MRRAMRAGLAYGGRFGIVSRRRCLSGFRRQTLGFFFGARTFGCGLFGAKTIRLRQTLLLFEVALTRFLELAKRLGALVIDRRFVVATRPTLVHQGDFLAHHHVDGLLIATTAHGDFLHLAACKRDLLRRFTGLDSGIATSMGTT